MVFLARRDGLLGITIPQLQRALSSTTAGVGIRNELLVTIYVVTRRKNGGVARQQAVLWYCRSGGTCTRGRHHMPVGTLTGSASLNEPLRTLLITLVSPLYDLRSEHVQASLDKQQGD